MLIWNRFVTDLTFYMFYGLRSPLKNIYNMILLNYHVLGTCRYNHNPERQINNRRRQQTTQNLRGQTNQILRGQTNLNMTETTNQNLREQTYLQPRQEQQPPFNVTLKVKVEEPNLVRYAVAVCVFCFWPTALFAIYCAKQVSAFIVCHWNFLLRLNVYVWIYIHRVVHKIP